MPDFLPRGELDLLNWSNVFRAAISVAPLSLGLTEQQVADYDAAHALMADFIQQAWEPRTRTSVVIVGKNESVAALRALARQYARIIRANPSVDSSQRVRLGLNPGEEKAKRIDAPATAPQIQIVSTEPGRVTLRLENGAETTRRGIPRGTIGAAIFACTSDTDPTPNDLWQPLAYTSTALTTIGLPHTMTAGAKLHLAAQWLSPRLKAGPMSRTVSTRVLGTVPMRQLFQLAA